MKQHVFSINDQVVRLEYIKKPSLPKKRIIEIAFISIIFAYSARKKSANGPEAYSTLKPDTSSDSPSTKSKGVRFVSAIVDTTHIIQRGHVNQNIDISSWAYRNDCMEKPPTNKTNPSRTNPRLTSYEMVWAIARRAPISAYLEFDAQPAPIIA